MLPDARDTAKQIMLRMRSDLSDLDEILAQVDFSQVDMMAMQNRARNIEINAHDLMDTLPKPQ